MRVRPKNTIGVTNQGENQRDQHSFEEREDDQEDAAKPRSVERGRSSFEYLASRFHLHARVADDSIKRNPDRDLP